MILILLLTNSILNAKAVLYLWTDKTHKTCAAYTPELSLIGTAKPSQCKTDDVQFICTPETVDLLDSQTRKLMDKVLNVVIPEVLTLKADAEVPKKIIQESNSRAIGKSLVSRLIEKTKPLTNDKNSYDFYKDTEIQMAFSEKNFESIRKGCFRNQFQTNSSKGFASRLKRQKAETTLIGVNIDSSSGTLTTPSDPSHHVRPKYAYLVPTKPMEDVPPLNYSESYGNIYAVMKSEVKDRSTFTAQDSLKVIEPAIPLNTKANYKEIRKGKTDYWEAQMWGEVCFNDVAYFIVNCPEKIEYPADSTKIRNYNRISDETLLKMKETGIPVYQCKKEQKGVNTIFTKGDVLSSENMSKRSLDESKAEPNSNFPVK